MEKNTSALTRSDHDTLIRLETKFDTFSTQVINDIKELKDGTQSRLSDLESRTAIIEKVHQEIQPIQGNKKLIEVLIWKSNLESNIKFLFLASSSIGSIIGFVLAVLTVVFHIVHL